MKRIKFLLALLMVMLGTAVQAQTVVVYKDGKVVREFQPEETDSVVYNPDGKIALLTEASLIDDYTMTSATDFRSLIKSEGTVTPSTAKVEWGTTLSKCEEPTNWVSAADAKPESYGDWQVWYRINATNTGYSNHDAVKVGKVTVGQYFDPNLDRNVYSDAACTQVLFDASKVVTGKTSIAGEAWANYSQYVVTIPEGVEELDMKVPFELYQNNPLANNTLKSCGDAKPWEGTYYMPVNPGQRFVILAKK